MILRRIQEYNCDDSEEGAETIATLDGYLIIFTDTMFKDFMNNSAYNSFVDFLKEREPEVIFSLDLITKNQGFTFPAVEPLSEKK